MRWCASASSVKLAAVAIFLLLLVARHRRRRRPSACPGSSRVAVAVALFLLALGTLGRRTRLAVGNSDIEFWIISNRIMPPIVAVLPIYVMFQQLRLLDTQHRADRHLHRGQPADRRLADARLLRRHPDRPRGERRARRRLEVPRLLHHRAAAGPLRPRRHLPAGADPRLERVSAGALPLQRQRADHAGAGLGAEHHARARSGGTCRC